MLLDKEESVDDDAEMLSPEEPVKEVKAARSRTDRRKENKVHQQEQQRHPSAERLLQTGTTLFQQTSTRPAATETAPKEPTNTTKKQPAAARKAAVKNAQSASEQPSSSSAGPAIALPKAAAGPAPKTIFEKVKEWEAAGLSEQQVQLLTQAEMAAERASPYKLPGASAARDTSSSTASELSQKPTAPAVKNITLPDGSVGVKQTKAAAKQKPANPDASAARSAAAKAVWAKRNEKKNDEELEKFMDGDDPGAPAGMCEEEKQLLEDGLDEMLQDPAMKAAADADLAAEGVEGPPESFDEEANLSELMKDTVIVDHGKPAPEEREESVAAGSAPPEDEEEEQAGEDQPAETGEAEKEEEKPEMKDGVEGGEGAAEPAAPVM
eukprot:g6125.t1